MAEATTTASTPFWWSAVTGVVERISARAHLYFAAVAIPLGLALVVLVPPFQAPDEPAHFFRAYAISEGQLFAASINGAGGNELPVSVATVPHLVMGDVPFHPHVRQDVQVVLEALSIPLQPEVRRPVEFAGSSVYFPVVYAPHAAALAVARWFGATPLVSLYLARLAGMLFAVLLTCWALRILPIQRLTFLAVAMVPMNGFARSALSADAVTTAVAFLLIAQCVRLAFASEEIRGRDIALVALTAALAGLTKQTYAVLALCFLIVPAAKLGGIRRKLALGALMVVVAIVPALIWSSQVATLFRPMGESKTTVADAVRAAADQPLHATKVVVNHVVRRRVVHFQTGMGVFGWLDAAMPKPALWTLLVLLFAVALTEGRGERTFAPSARAVLLMTWAIGVTGIVAILYLTWVPPGANWVAGVQGRYFLPLWPLPLLAIHGLARFLPSRLNGAAALALAGFTALSVAGTVTTIWQRYYGP